MLLNVARPSANNPKIIPQKTYMKSALLDYITKIKKSNRNGELTISSCGILVVFVHE